MRNVEFIKCSIVVLLSILAISRAGCPTDDAAVSIDLDKFSGKWYVVSATPAEKGISKCLRFSVEKISPSEFRMNFTAISWRNSKTVLWKVEGRKFEGGINATWQFSSSPRKLGPFKHQIIDINYESHVALIICDHRPQFAPKSDSAMIWSRERTMNNSTLVYLKEKVARYVAKEDFIDIDNTCTTLF